MVPTSGRKNRKKEHNKANFEEPKIKWKNSDAKWLLYKDIMEDLVLLKATYNQNIPTIYMRSVYLA
jgi:hypothetical protein